METIDPLFGIALVIFGILQLILFFKIWGMTNDVRKLKDYFVLENLVNIPETEVKERGWSDNVTDQEVTEAMKLIAKMKPDSVIALVLSNKRMEVWSTDFWEKEKGNPNYKLIFKG